MYNILLAWCGEEKLYFFYCDGHRVHDISRSIIHSPFLYVHVIVYLRENVICSHHFSFLPQFKVLTQPEYTIVEDAVYL